MIPDEDMHRHAAENIAQADALLFGRVTYEMMEAAWRPARTGARPEWMAEWMEPFARTIDSAKKYVVSSTLERVDWNAELVRGDLGKAVQRLKRESGKGLFTGGVTLPLALAELGLIDEYEFVVHPRIAGHGPTLFAGLSAEKVDIPMNLARIALAALAALVAYFIVGGIFFVIPAMRTEFAKYPAIFRTGEATNSVMPVGVLGILLAIAAAATIFARMHPTGAGIKEGLKFGVILAVFQLGSFVLHNHMLLNIGWRLSALQGIVYAAEWIVVGLMISLVYRG
jgi:dihydrofolate reductase